MASRHVTRIRKLDWNGLRLLWGRVKAGHTPGWGAGKALEYLVLRGFELSGAEVVWPYEVNIANQVVEQIDGIAYFAGLSCLVECKDTADPVNVEPLSKMRNQLLRRPSGAIGVVVSRSGFTGPAQTLAQYMAPQTILLCAGLELDHILQTETFTSALEKKYRYCIQMGIPDYDTRVEAIA